MGRVSLTIRLEELPLYDANQFWENRSISSYEKFKVLGVTGGIPRYLEEIRPELTAEENIKKMCFSKGGILVEEFDKIFHDIFEKKADSYKKIVQTLTLGRLEIKEICEKLNIEPSGTISKELQTLMLSGFIARDYVWNNGEKKAKLSKYRLKDNYLRFYLKYIEPKKDLINKGLYDQLHLEELNQWDTIMGLQFENLVHNNLRSIQQILNISSSSMLSASSYFQKKTLRKESCQIDLLIQNKHTLYVCEINFRKAIPFSIIEEVSEKIRKLKVEKMLSVRPVLIY